MVQPYCKGTQTVYSSLEAGEDPEKGRLAAWEAAGLCD